MFADSNDDGAFSHTSAKQWLFHLSIHSSSGSVLCAPSSAHCVAKRGYLGNSLRDSAPILDAPPCLCSDSAKLNPVYYGRLYDRATSLPPSFSRLITFNFDYPVHIESAHRITEHHGRDRPNVSPNIQFFFSPHSYSFFLFSLGLLFISLVITSS